MPRLARLRPASILCLALLLLTACSAPPVAPLREQPAVATSEPVDATAQATVAATNAPPEVAASATSPTPAETLPPIEQFFEQSFEQLLLRDPEAITEAGVADLYGVGNDRLTDISQSYQQETQQLERQLLAELRRYDRESLTPAQQLSYDIYEWHLADLVRGQQFSNHSYPATFFLTSVHLQLQQFFTDLHPVDDLEGAQDYVTRLAQVDDKIDQLIANLEQRAELGIIPPSFVFLWTLPGIREITDVPPSRNPFYSAFAAKVAALDNVDDVQKQALLLAAEAQVEASVTPAYRALYDALSEQQHAAPRDVGVWNLPDGDAYYAYLLQHYTTTDLTADEIHELGKQELSRIHSEMRARFEQLGYDAAQPLPALYERVAADSGFLRGAEVQAEYERLIDEAARNVGAAFDLTPQADVIVVGGSSGGYYIPPAVDGSRPGAFYAATTGTAARFAMPTLAYHEAIPGHHFQIAIMQELPDLPTFRNGINFTAYAEGWALYAERLAAELGFYADDPYGDLGRLQGEAFRAARLVVDTGIHSRRWSYSEAVDYMHTNTGMPQRSMEWEVARYVVWPGQATAYKIGMNQILALRQRAAEQLGDDFDLKAFHNAVIGNGSMPLSVLERVVDSYIESR